MFGSKKAAVSFTGEIETIIGKGTVFTGTVNGKGAIRVDGQLDGDLQTSGDLMVGESAQIKAQVKARSAIVGGVIYGNMEIQEKLELLPTAQLHGDIKVGALIIGEGAVFKEACQMNQNAATVPSKEAKSK